MCFRFWRKLHIGTERSVSLGTGGERYSLSLFAYPEKREWKWSQEAIPNGELLNHWTFIFGTKIDFTCKPAIKVRSWCSCFGFNLDSLLSYLFDILFKHHQNARTQTTFISHASSRRHHFIFYFISHHHKYIITWFSIIDDSPVRRIAQIICLYVHTEYWRKSKRNEKRTPTTTIPHSWIQIKHLCRVSQRERERENEKIVNTQQTG